MNDERIDRDTLPQPDWHREWTDLEPAATKPHVGLDRSATDLPSSRELAEDRDDESQTKGLSQGTAQKGREDRQEGEQESQQGGRASHDGSFGRRQEREEGGQGQ